VGRVAFVWADRILERRKHREMYRAGKRLGRPSEEKQKPLSG